MYYERNKDYSDQFLPFSNQGNTDKASGIQKMVAMVIKNFTLVMMTGLQSLATIICP